MSRHRPVSPITKFWLRTTGDDNRQHVIFRPEVPRHTLTLSCPCGPREELGVIIHTLLSRWTPPWPMQGTRMEH